MYLNPACVNEYISLKNKEKEEKKRIEDERLKREEEKRKRDEIIEINGVRFQHGTQFIGIPRDSWISGRAYDAYPYSAIQKYEYYEDSKMITEGGIGTALVGGVLFGPVGAIVGASGGRGSSRSVEKQEVHIVIRKPETRDIKIYKIDVKHVFKYSRENAEKLMLVLREAMDLANPKVELKTGNMINHENDIPDQIRKYKSLVDEGIISQEEFVEKKKQLLGL